MTVICYRQWPNTDAVFLDAPYRRTCLVNVAVDNNDTV